MSVRKLLTAAKGERITSLHPRGDGSFVLVTPSLLVHVGRWQSTSDRPPDGRSIDDVLEGPGPDAFRLLLDDGDLITLERIEAVKRGHTPIEGVPVIGTRRGPPS